MSVPARRPIKLTYVRAFVCFVDLVRQHDSRRALPPYHLPLAEDEGGGYLIELPDLPGCMLDGGTIEEAVTNGLDAMRG